MALVGIGNRNEAFFSLFLLTRTQKSVKLQAKQMQNWVEHSTVLIFILKSCWPPTSRPKRRNKWIKIKQSLLLCLLMWIQFRNADYFVKDCFFLNSFLGVHSCMHFGALLHVIWPWPYMFTKQIAVIWENSLQSSWQYVCGVFQHIFQLLAFWFIFMRKLQFLWHIFFCSTL